MSQDSIPSCKADIACHGRCFRFYRLFADLYYKFVADTERLFPGLLCKDRIVRIFHIIIAVYAALDLDESGADITDDIFYFPDIDISDLVTFCSPFI